MQHCSSTMKSQELCKNIVHSIPVSFTKYHRSPCSPQKKHTTYNINRIDDQPLTQNNPQHAFLARHLPHSRRRLAPKARAKRAHRLTRREAPRNPRKPEGEDRDPPADCQSRRDEWPLLYNMRSPSYQTLLQHDLSAPEGRARLAAY